MGLKDIYNSIKGGAGNIKESLSDIFAIKPITYRVSEKQQPKDIYTVASENTKKKYGVDVPPHFLKAVRQQESSGIVDESDLNLSMGITPTAITALGEDYLQPTSLDNVVQNSANYLASRARGIFDSGEKFDYSTPENLSKWYVQRYVGLLPGETRKIGGQNVSYEKIVDLFENLLSQYNK